MSSAALTPSLAATFEAARSAPRPQAIDKVRYSHKAMVDMIVANPWISQAELARNFGYTEGWVSQVIASDAFQAHLESRKDELVDPHIRATIEERFKGLVARSIELLMRKLDDGPKVSDETLLRALEISSKAAGYGAKGAAVQINQQFVVAVPPKSASSADWHKEHSSSGSPVSTPPAFKTAQTVEDAVLVDSGSGELNTKQLLSLLTGPKGA